MFLLAADPADMVPAPRGTGTGAGTFSRRGERMRAAFGGRRRSWGVLAACLLACGLAPWGAADAFGQARTFVLTGEVTEVTDELGWFNGLLNVGTPITG